MITETTQEQVPSINPPARIELAAVKPTQALNYEYGVRLDPECVPAVREQITKARRFYNELVACMQSVFDEARAFTLRHAGPDAQALSMRIEALTLRFKQARAANDEEELRAAASERRAARSELWPLLKATRLAHKAELNAIFAKVGKNSACVTYQARTEAVKNGLGWATANAVLDAAMTAWKKSLMYGHAPRFANGELKLQDTLTLQFTQGGGIPASSILAGESQEFELIPSAGCGKRKYGTFSFRLGPAANGAYATGTWQYHKPIPERAHVSLARLVRKRIGKDFRYTIQLLLTLPSPVLIPPPNGRRELVAVHFGWAADVTGRRVAGVSPGGDPSQARLVQMPQDIEGDLERASAIQAGRAESRTRITPLLKQIDAEKLPPELKEELLALRRLPAEHIAHKRLHRLSWEIAKAGIEVPWLLEWRRQDRLAWQSMAHVARTARMRRREYWRKFALDLVRRYEVVAIEPLNLSEAAQKVDEETGERSKFGAKARSGRVVAGLYELEQAIRWCCEKTATPLIEVAASTLECAYCHGPTVEDEKNYHIIHCTQCGAEVDRKLNGAARAWQFVSPDLARWRETYEAYREKAIAEAAEKKREKREKLLLGRAKGRMAKEQPEAGGLGGGR